MIRNAALVTIAAIAVSACGGSDVSRADAEPSSFQECKDQAGSDATCERKFPEHREAIERAYQEWFSEQVKPIAEVSAAIERGGEAAGTASDGALGAASASLDLALTDLRDARSDFDAVEVPDALADDEAAIEQIRREGRRAFSLAENMLVSFKAGVEAYDAVEIAAGTKAIDDTVTQIGVFVDGFQELNAEYCPSSGCDNPLEALE